MSTARPRSARRRASRGFRASLGGSRHMLLSVRSKNFIFQVNFICRDDFICQLNFICQASQLFLSSVRSKNPVFKVNFVCQVNFCCCLWDQTTLSVKSILFLLCCYVVVGEIKHLFCCRIILTSFHCRGRQGRGGGGENYELSVLEDFRAQRPHRVLQRPRHGLHVSTHVQSPKVIQQAKSPQTAQDSILPPKKWFLTTAPPKLSCLSLSYVSFAFLPAPFRYHLPQQKYPSSSNIILPFTILVTLLGVSRYLC